MSCPYKSLVFLDLEATDLPHARPAITELSFVACSTLHFQTIDPGTDKLPRVLHKLTICLNPNKRIVPEAVVLSGLDNFLLENELALTGNTVRLLSSFLDNLQQPVCLVAHNGTGFDFPLLAKSFKEYNMMISVDCADSLVVFRKIDDKEESLRNFIDSELAELESVEAEQAAIRQTVVADASTSATTRPDSPELFTDDAIDDDTLTQLTEQAEQMYNCDATTPVDKKLRVHSPPRVASKPAGQRFDRRLLKPRQLFRPSYKLTAIFERFYGRIPDNAHRAEEDTLILLKCARFRASEFVLHIPASVRQLSSYAK